jgi:aquaporin related protein
MNNGRPADTFTSQPGMKPTYTNESNRPLGQKPLPGLHKLPLSVRGTIVSMLGEFVGTFLFLFFAFAATQVANMALAPATGPNLAALLYISLAFGFSLAVNVWVFFRISGGLFNPAVSFCSGSLQLLNVIMCS